MRLATNRFSGSINKDKIPSEVQRPMSIIKVCIYIPQRLGSMLLTVTPSQKCCALLGHQCCWLLDRVHSQVEAPKSTRSLQLVFQITTISFENIHVFVFGLIFPLLPPACLSTPHWICVVYMAFYKVSLYTTPRSELHVSHH